MAPPLGQETDAECAEWTMVDELYRQSHRGNSGHKQCNLIQREKHELVLCDLAGAAGDNHRERDSGGYPEEEEERDVDREFPTGPEFVLRIEKDHRDVFGENGVVTRWGKSGLTPLAAN